MIFVLIARLAFLVATLLIILNVLVPPFIGKEFWWMFKKGKNKKKTSRSSDGLPKTKEEMEDYINSMLGELENIQDSIEDEVIENEEERERLQQEAEDKKEAIRVAKEKLKNLKS